MLPNLVFDVTFYELLHRIDLDLADEARGAGCPLCGDVVHTSRYPRKLRGVPLVIAGRFRRRESFCCAVRDCRKRVTPPSVIFLSRKLYPFVVVVLVGALREALTPRRLARLRRTFDVSPETIARWREYWAAAFAGDEHLVGLRGLVGVAGDLRRLLRRLRSGGQRLGVVLFLLTPLSTHSVDPALAWRWALKIRRGRFVPSG